MKANSNTAGDPWGPWSGTDGSGPAAAVAGSAPAALQAPASSRAAGLLRRIDLPLDRPSCFYILGPSLCTGVASHTVCAYLLWQQPKGWNIPFLQV